VVLTGGDNKPADAQPDYGNGSGHSYDGVISSKVHFHLLNPKDCCVPEMGFVTVYWPLMTTGAGRLVIQTGEARFLVDCRVYLV
jgi:hypothetical protein